MRNLDKINARKIYSMDRGKISLILMTGVTIGVVVFVVGLLVGLRKPGEAQAAPQDTLDKLISQNGATPAGAAEPAPQAGAPEDEEPGVSLALEYASKLTESPGRSVVPPLIPAEAEEDTPLPAEFSGQPGGEGELADAQQAAQSAGIRITKNPADIAFTEPVHAPVAQSGEKGVFTLHISSFFDKSEAAGYVAQLRKAGYRAFLVSTTSEDRGPLFRVRIGPFFSKNEAEKYRKKFEEVEGIPTYVVKRVILG